MNKDYIKDKVPKRLRPRIQMLESCFGWDSGTVFSVDMETNDELYFNDVNDRWSYVEKKEEYKDFIYVNRYKE
jgi:hypothetical protein